MTDLSLGQFEEGDSIAATINTVHTLESCFLIHTFFIVLSYALVGQVAKNIQRRIQSEEHYHEDGVKLEK